jgi:ribonuclease P protein component
LDEKRVLMPKQFTLSKNERLKSRKAIEHLFKEGLRFSVSPFRVYYTFSSTTGLKFGAGVSARNFRKAVDRNKIKRLTREAYRLQKLSLEETLNNRKTGLHVFLIYTDKELPSYKKIFDKVHVILNKLDQQANENITLAT